MHRRLAQIGFPLWLFLAGCGDRQVAAGLNNWYFDFFASPVEMKAEIKNPAGQAVQTATGEIRGEYRRGGTEFVQRSTFKYEPQFNEVTGVLVWKAGPDGIPVGTYTDSNGTSASYSLTLKGTTEFRIDSSGPEGMTISTEGVLRLDGTIEAVETMKAADGKVMATLVSRLRRGATGKEDP